MKSEERERLAELVGRMTPAPWRVEHGDALYNGDGFISATDDDIAAAVALRNAAPDLLAEIGRLEGDIREAVRERDSATQQIALELAAVRAVAMERDTARAEIAKLREALEQAQVRLEYIERRSASWAALVARDGRIDCAAALAQTEEGEPFLAEEHLCGGGQWNVADCAGCAVEYDKRSENAEEAAGRDIRAFWNEQAEWSRATFGSDAERGPRGPLKHLAKEVKEALDALDAGDSNGVNSEVVDCLFLTFDAARRNGMTFDDLLEGAFAKLAINKLRVWQTPTSDEPVEHDRTAEKD